MSSQTAHPAASYFELFRKTRHQGSLVDDFVASVDIAIGAALSNRPSAAVEQLRRLRQLLEQGRPVIDGTVERDHRHFIEIMALRKDRLELRLELALINDNEHEAREIEEELNSLSGFFAEAIADLDPDAA